MSLDSTIEDADDDDNNDVSSCVPWGVNVVEGVGVTATAEVKKSVLMGDDNSPT